MRPPTSSRSASSTRASTPSMRPRCATRSAGSTPDNAQGEMYLTDVLSHARSAGGRVGALVVEDVWQVEGVNDRVQLAALHRELNRRTVQRWMRAGRTVVDPLTTWIDAGVTLEPDTCSSRTPCCAAPRMSPPVPTRPELPPRRHPGRRRRDRQNTTSDGAIIGPEATVGPYTLSAARHPARPRREGRRLRGDEEGRVRRRRQGAAPLYVGDADIGEGANIGAGTIFANYDGVAKHHTDGRRTQPSSAATPCWSHP